MKENVSGCFFSEHSVERIVRRRSVGYMTRVDDTCAGGVGNCGQNVLGSTGSNEGRLLGQEAYTSAIY